MRPVSGLPLLCDHNCTKNHAATSAEMSALHVGLLWLASIIDAVGTFEVAHKSKPQILQKLEPYSTTTARPASGFHHGILQKSYISDTRKMARRIISPPVVFLCVCHSIDDFGSNLLRLLAEASAKHQPMGFAVWGV